MSTEHNTQTKESDMKQSVKRYHYRPGNVGHYENGLYRGKAPDCLEEAS